MILDYILIGTGLAMDAFAVTLSNLCAFKGSYKKFLLMPLAFGLFQFLMPVIGYFAGSIFSDILKKYAGIVTLVILGYIGIKAIIDAVKGDDADSCPVLTLTLIIIQAITTSIDALMVGVSFCAQEAEVFLPSAVIGITTFLIVLCAIPIGRKFGNMLGSKAQILGGVILCLIGLKSFFGI